ncbi:Rna recognition motif-containing protein [Cardiosporidium cionae]|uniref:Rna recognition motif-containing protein n=1 Tax=Cardiosporidium cionae TaxID=476202 RepID=A0ABQ7JFK6_9APIC|nr:Rna recognition motif-containing protein [Cardiosporidium cionae]|eukprot:KAF8822801.1 Rna recognition motif-containing protein [Cardiosporidium cionae]
MPRVICIPAKKRCLTDKDNQPSKKLSANISTCKDTKETTIKDAKFSGSKHLQGTASSILQYSTVQKQPLPASSRTTSNRTLWIGDLDKAAAAVTADENYVTYHMFYEFTQSISRVKVCRDRQTGVPTYGFVEFSTHDVAKYCLENLNHRWVPGRSHKYKLNWATFNVSDPKPPATLVSMASRRRATTCDTGETEVGANANRDIKGNGTSSTTSIWVGSLDPATVQEELEEIFAQYYNSVALVKLVSDPVTGLCKGFGFVHFTDPAEAERALGEMNGAICRGRRIKVNPSNTNKDRYASSYESLKNGSDPYVQSAMHKLYEASASAAQNIASQCGYVATKKKTKGESASCGAKLAIRGIDLYCTDDVLYRHFAIFGQVLSAKVVADRSKGYVTFAEEDAALNALRVMDGSHIGASKITVEQLGYGVQEYEAGIQMYNATNFCSSDNTSSAHYSSILNCQDNLGYLQYDSSNVDEATRAQNDSNLYGYCGTTAVTLYPELSKKYHIAADDSENIMTQKSIKAVAPDIVPGEILHLLYENDTNYENLDDHNIAKLDTPCFGMFADLFNSVKNAVKHQRSFDLSRNTSQKLIDVEMLCEALRSTQQLLYSTGRIHFTVSSFLPGSLLTKGSGVPSLVYLRHYSATNLLSHIGNRLLGNGRNSKNAKQSPLAPWKGSSDRTAVPTMSGSLPLAKVLTDYVSKSVTAAEGAVGLDGLITGDRGKDEKLNDIYNFMKKALMKQKGLFTFEAYLIYLRVLEAMTSREHASDNPHIFDFKSKLLLSEAAKVKLKVVEKVFSDHDILKTDRTWYMRRIIMNRPLPETFADRDLEARYDRPLWKTYSYGEKEISLELKELRKKAKKHGLKAGRTKPSRSSMSSALI